MLPSSWHAYTITQNFHTPLLKIEEDIEFPKVLAAKQLPEKV
jgi:hypothetical protein